MIKHIGRHNNRKIILLYRQVPGEDHMCLISYSDALPSVVHDDIMKTLESAAGQQSQELNEVLFRTLGTNGNNLLETLHRGGWIKKVPTNQVIITPNTTSSVRLDELNKILNELKKGESAAQKLQELDSSQGMVMPNKSKKNKPVEVKTSSQDITGESNDSGLLTDAAIAADLKAQADRMAAQAKTLLEESNRLLKEAAALTPTPLESNGTTKTKAKTRVKKTPQVQEN